MKARHLCSLAIAASLCIGLAACDGDERETFGCDQSASLGTCVEHGTMSPQDIAYAKGYCEGNQGIWLVNQPCPSAGRFGSCDMRARGGGVQYFYSGCTWCSGIAASCTSNGGTWTPLP